MKDMRKGGPSSTLNNHINFSLGPSSTSRFLPQIAENESELNDPTFSSLKRNRDGVLKMSQVHSYSRICNMHYTPTFLIMLCFFGSCDRVCRMERLVIILRIWYTIWACQKLPPKWLLLKISCISNKIRRFLGKHVQKEDLLHTHEASQKGYQNLYTLNLICSVSYTSNINIHLSSFGHQFSGEENPNQWKNQKAARVFP